MVDPSARVNLLLSPWHGIFYFTGSGRMKQCSTITCVYVFSKPSKYSSTLRVRSTCGIHPPPRSGLVCPGFPLQFYYPRSRWPNSCRRHVLAFISRISAQAGDDKEVGTNQHYTRFGITRLAKVVAFPRRRVSIRISCAQRVSIGCREKISGTEFDNIYDDDTKTPITVYEELDFDRTNQAAYSMSDYP